MKTTHEGISPRRARRRQSGYAFLVAMGMVAIMAASSVALLQNMVTEGRRERESESIWRGEQYKRAIRSYYRKTGHFPQTLDDLDKGLPELHFLRHAHTDPLNKADGEWRPIYVNASGQIIGSVRYSSLQQMVVLDVYKGQMPGAGAPGMGAAGQSAANTAGASQASGSAGMGGSNGLTATSDTGLGAPAGSSQNITGAGQTQTPAATNSQPTPVASLAMGGVPTGPVDGPVLGAFIIGVGGKVDRGSMRVYGGGKSYKEWEFIWNPLEEQARAVMNATGQATAGVNLNLTQTATPTAPAATPTFGMPGGLQGSNGGSPFSQ